MKVSVIIPVYNAEKFIVRAIQSALVFKDVGEIIIINDKSTDNTLLLCESEALKDSRIKIFHHPNKVNKGVAASRNLGIREAKFKYISFLDADDYYLENRYEKSLEILDNFKNIDGVYEAVCIIQTKNPKEPYNSLQTLDKEIAPKDLFYELSPIGQCGLFQTNGVTLRREVFDKMGAFDEELRISEDTLMWLKIAYSLQLASANLTKPVAVRTKHENNLTGNLSVVIEYNRIMLQKLQNWNGGDKPFSKKIKSILYERLLYNYFLLERYSNRNNKNKSRNKTFKAHLKSMIQNPSQLFLLKNYKIAKSVLLNWEDLQH